MTEARISLVTGAHRSGTTWVGQALAEVEGCAVLHEPFNFQFGVDGVPQWYPKAGTAEERALLAPIFERVVSGKARYRVRRSDDTPLKALARLVSGGPDNWTYRRQFRQHPSRIVLKDPFCVRMARWLGEVYGVRSAVLVRHPGAYLNSLRRMSWTIPEDAFGGATGDAGSGTAPETLTEACRVARFWAGLYGDVIAQADAAPDHVRLFRHEDLCLDPIGEGERLFAHIGVPFTDAARAYLARTTSGTVVNPEQNVLHAFDRKSAEMIHSWRGKVSAEEQGVLHEVGGAVFARLYPEAEYAFDALASLEG